MPKVLSLKKPQAGASKNQKTLTEFMQIANRKASVVPKTEIPTKGIENGVSSSKRKASSPISGDSEDMNGQFNHERNSPKKIKTEKNNKSPLTLKSNSPKKISPNKENKGLSPTKSIFSYFEGSSSTVQKEGKSCVLTDIDNFKNHGQELLDVDLNGESCAACPDIKPNCIQNDITDKQSLIKVNTPKKKSSNKRNEKKSQISPQKNINSSYFNGSNNNGFNAQSSSTVKLEEKSSTLTDNHYFENHVQKVFDVDFNNDMEPNSIQNGVTDKQSPYKNGESNVSSPKKQKTPKKSPLTEFFCSPNNKFKSPEKDIKDVMSPSKTVSKVKALDFSLEEECDEFGDEWDMDDMEDVSEDLDLSTMQRCQILSIKELSHRLELRLQCDDKKATCYVEGIWLDTPLVPNETVSILASRDSSGQFSVTNTSGLLVLRPDHLVSSTSVVAGVFCKRKAILQERWRGIDSANMAMTTGILIHELVQKALTQKITSIEVLRTVAADIIKESVDRLYDAGLSEAEARSTIQNYIPPLADFMNTYVAEKPPTVTNVQKDKNNWSGHIEKVLDIEENLCCPKLGLKGKIDATVQVTIHERKGRQRAIVPLELKSGKASMSAEHRGQLVLYGMMLNLQNSEDPTLAAQRGLLLYLKDRVELKEVSCGYPERRDLVMLRNQLVQYLAASPQDMDPDQLTDIEDASIMLQQKLPEPVDHHNACAKCPYLTICSLHLWHTDGPTVSEQHPLSKLRTEALGHLSNDHIKYFLHWTALLKMEERGQMAKSPLHALWTYTVEKREKRGACAANLRLKSATPSGDRFLNIFQRTTDKVVDVDVKSSKGPQEGEFSIVGIENRPWIAAGVITVANTKEIHILLERDLTRRLNKDTVYHIDTYESYATTVQNLTNLGVLIEDSDRAERLRKLIIDKEPPQFEAKLHRDVGRLGTKLMKSLNIQQQRAVLKALAARDYALMRGLPGTGKTQTISVLIQMLVALKQRVLVTAHTHSAVDTVLSRLPESLRVMRLGSSARVAPALLKRSEQSLTADCTTPDQLAQLYDSMDVVGVTCLGAAHAMLARTTFDLCIVDEATQVLQCTVLRPLFAAKRFVLVGDPDQLPPVVRSKAARRLGMEDSLFHRLMCESATSTLQLQYRMNQALADLANHVAYNDRLKCADQSVATAKLDIDVKKISLLSGSPWLSMVCSPEPQHAALFLNVETVEDMVDATNKNSCSNHVEACIVVAVVVALKQGNVKSSDIGVIAPYRDQVALLRRSLLRHSIDVSTVDQFQGRDKPVIIYSCTKKADKQEDKKVKEGEVLNDQRRLAVSVTRAKHKFLIIGDSAALRRYAPLQRLIQSCTTVNLDKDVVNIIRDKYNMYVS